MGICKVISTLRQKTARPSDEPPPADDHQQPKVIDWLPGGEKAIAVRPIYALVCCHPEDIHMGDASDNHDDQFNATASYLSDMDIDSGQTRQMGRQRQVYTFQLRKMVRRGTDAVSFVRETHLWHFRVAECGHGRFIEQMPGTDRRKMMFDAAAQHKDGFGHVLGVHARELRCRRHGLWKFEIWLQFETPPNTPANGSEDAGDRQAESDGAGRSDNDERTEEGTQVPLSNGPLPGGPPTTGVQIPGLESLILTREDARRFQATMR